MFARSRCTILAGTASLLACSQPKPSETPSSDEAARPEIAAFWQSYESVGKQGDAPALAALHTDSVTVAFTGAPTFRGRGTFQAFLNDVLKTTTCSRFAFTPQRQWIRGDRAFQVGIFEEAYRAAGKEPQVDDGRMAASLVRDSEGAWRIDDLVAIVDSTIPR